MDVLFELLEELISRVAASGIYNSKKKGLGIKMFRPCIKTRLTNMEMFINPWRNYMQCRFFLEDSG